MEKYVVNKEIGSGSFGKVFVVESKSTGIHYVAKQIDLIKMENRQRKGAENEIQVLAKLKHPNIVREGRMNPFVMALFRYRESYTDNTHLYIIMELCDMGDLHRMIQDVRQRNDRIPDSLSLQYFVQICLALNYTHQQKILHRDLKTKNIFLKRGNIIKLGDFGVSKVLENSFELAQTCIGSPFYISPEICNNKPYDKKSDIWALGCVLFEITTLKYAFTATNMKTLITKITSGEYASLPANVSPRIQHLIKKLLTVETKQRPAVDSILSWPFVSEVVDNLNCRMRSTCPKRDESGKQCFSKTARCLLPKSKSCVNLIDDKITEPQTKYKPAANKIRSGKIQSPNNLTSRKDPVPITVRSSAPIDNPKIKKLPTTDSLYYSLIADNSKMEAKRSLPLIKNIFQKPNAQENIKNCNVISTSNVEIDTNNNCSTVNEDDTHDSILNGRKNWSVNTCDKNQLISLLSEVDLISTFEGSNIQGSETSDEKPQTIDELLFSYSVDLSHIPILEPEQLYQNEIDEYQETNLLNKDIDDSTYCIVPVTESEYEQLEKRRVDLEQKLGLEPFLHIYKYIQTNCYDRADGMLYKIKNIQATAGMLNINEQTLIDVWRLIYDEIQ